METITILTIESNSHGLNVLPVQIVEAKGNIWGTLIDYRLKLITSRQIAVTLTDVVATECFSAQDGEEQMKFFFP